MKIKPTLLCILDGFGESEQIEGNAIKAATTPTIDKLYTTCPHSQILTHGEHIGLPAGQMGNSEVGHMAIGSGRINLSSLVRIQRDITSGKFETKTAFKKFISKVGDEIHLIGMVSDGGVHSHMDHLIGLCDILDKLGKQIFIHVITDGRDTNPLDAKNQLKTFQKAVKGKNIQIVDIIGRFYAMDRDNRFNRTQKAYNLYTRGDGEQASSIIDAIKVAHSQNINDEHIKPTTIINAPIKNNMSVIFFNFRSDRMRQITHKFINSGLNLNIATMCEYDAKFNKHVTTFYLPEKISGLLGEVVASAGLTQLRIAETEKYAHITFFMNGGEEKSFKGEDRILIPSPKVKTYDKQPEMSLPELTKQLVDAISEDKYSLIILNIANGDMVGHSGNFSAAVKAVETIDTSLAKILNAVKQSGGEAIITSDHGNCEEMLAETGGTSTAHSLNPVPCIYVGKRSAKLINGTLADIAPTILTIMGVPQPREMTGKCLISFS